MRPFITLRRLAAAGLALALMGVALAEPALLTDLITARPVGAEGTVVVPDNFVRPWDPVTVFYAADMAAAGPEDDPKRFVRLSPGHPGEWRWLDARTLQFRPAEPWPPLAKFNWRAGDQDVVLTTLMTPPIAAMPSDGAEGLAPVEEIALTFANPMDPEVLEEMLTIELRPLPGVGAAAAVVLSEGDFSVKAMELPPSNPATVSAEAYAPQDSGGYEPSDSGGYDPPPPPVRSTIPERGATYVLRPDHPIEAGLRATVRMRLSLQDPADRSQPVLSFSTAEPFRVKSLGCAGGMLPVSPEGVSYTKDQAISCGAGAYSSVVVDLSAAPRWLGPVEARNLVRFEPAVREVEATVSGRRVEIRGQFERETLYRVTLAPAAVQDQAGRSLQISGESSAWLFFPRRSRYLRWSEGQGVSERYGPRRVPLEGRGHTRVDLRIYPIDPLDRSFWPFPDEPIAVDESARPPGPGELPEPHESPTRAISAGQIAQQLTRLGAPPISKLIELPLREDGAAASFGLDLAPHLDHLSGAQKPGTYLVGIRSLDAGTTRHWMRLQVTDLALSTLEEPDRVRFVVTSLSTGKPISGAQIEVQGAHMPRRGEATWTTLASGTTSAQGWFEWMAPGPTPELTVQVSRIVVRKGDDVLVLNASRPPESFQQGYWGRPGETWLQWAFQLLTNRGPKTQRLLHIFTERPVYRPDEEVHIRGYVRDHTRGVLSAARGTGFVVVRAPADMEWRYPVTLTETGGFYWKFEEDELPTGIYTASYVDDSGAELGRVLFKKEAYRIPEFEVDIAGPERMPLDRELELTATASYYAGGRVSGQPVRWRVSQFPYAYTPPAREGWLFSSDGRYSGEGRFVNRPVQTQEGTTDESGAARLVIDPTIEPTAQPRTYQVEVTITGADDQTVSSTRSIIALPSFVIGLKTPRYLEKTTTLRPEILAIGPDDKPVAGQELTVTLKRREWHSYLQASDFTTGAARYVTDIVDEHLLDKTVTTGAEPVTVELPTEGAGVYIIEVQGQDRIGRGQVVSVDLYVAGDEPVSWEKPSTPTFELSADKKSYDPGQAANVVIRSPFQEGQALVVVEAPEGNEYQWVAVRGGKATVKVPIRKTMVPKVPVHVLLERGRVELPGEKASADLGRPATMASTTWLAVNPVENVVNVKLEHPSRAMPGDKVPLTLRLSDNRGKPLSGEVTLWLVDAAVLALGKEQRLDPLPDFLTEVRSFLRMLDTRNGVIGWLPFAEMPGGDGPAEEDGGIKATVRRNFKSVPYYEPFIKVGPDGVAKVTVTLPDNLTTFRVRAKATSGADRFGFGKSDLEVRLPVMAQPALPRFVRPGDRFDAVAIGRIVEGAGGAGAAEIKAEGLTLSGAARQTLSWDPQKAARLAFPVTVQDPGYTPDGAPVRDRVTVQIAVRRDADGAADAFEVALPIRPDRDLLAVRAISELSAGGSLPLPQVPDARANTLRRTVLIADNPGLVRMSAGLDFLVERPLGNTEQRVSRARSMVALSRFKELVGQEDGSKHLDKAVADTLAWLPQVLDENGLVAYWPGSRGYVALTAWTLQFLVEAGEAGFRVDPGLQEALQRSLQQSLRSDYRFFISGEDYVERALSLNALTRSGKFEAAFFSELARTARWLDAEGVAQVALAGADSGQAEASVLKGLARTLSDGVLVRLYQGKELYNGLQDVRGGRSGLILPSETRILAQIGRALSKIDAENPKLPLVFGALVQLGKEDGWGNTNTNAEALLALSERLANDPTTRSHSARLVEGKDTRTLSIDPKNPLARHVGLSGAAGSLALSSGPGPIVVRVETRYLPKADGSMVEPAANGFAVTRRMLRVLSETSTEKIELDSAGKTLSFSTGTVIEEHVQVVNTSDRHHVAIVVPLAAGLEPLNPSLATAPPEARPSGRITTNPTYATYLDDGVSFFYNTLPKGTYDFYFRTRATTPGSFVQPPARAELTYDGTVWGQSAGARVEVTRVD